MLWDKKKTTYVFVGNKTGENDEFFGAVQRFLFELGCGWASGGASNVYEYDCDWIKISKSGEITCASMRFPIDGAAKVKAFSKLINKQPPPSTTHKITIDCKEIELSEESFKTLKDSLS